jgi:hypothetical protein
MSKITLNPITDREYGAVEVPRGWSEIFAPLLEKFNLDYHGFPDRPTNNVYVTETDKFRIIPGYDWECTCGAEDEDPSGELACDHDENCDLLKPNFLYKPTGFKLYWYKYPMRGSEMVPGITTEEFMRIILDCMKG